MFTVARAPVFTLPSVSELASVICVVPPVSETAPWKSFAEVSVMELAPALMLVAPVTVIAPV